MNLESYWEWCEDGGTRRCGSCVVHLRGGPGQMFAEVQVGGEARDAGAGDDDLHDGGNCTGYL